MDTHVKSIIIMKLGSWGETCAANFMTPALKEKFPQARVTLVLGRRLADWAGALQFDDVILVDEALAVKDQRLGLSSRLARGVALVAGALKIRQKKYDLGFCLHHDKFSGALLRLGGVKNVIGFSLGPAGAAVESKKNGGGGKLWPLHQAVEFKPYASEIDNDLSLLAAAGVVPLKLNFKLKVRQHVHEDILKRLAFDGLRAQGYLAVGIGAGVPRAAGTAGGDEGSLPFMHKRWPYMAEFLRLFCEKTGLPILLLGTHADLDLVPALSFVDHDRVKSWVGLTTREEALAVISQAVAFVGCDSGLARVAGSVGVPSVVVYGPTSSKVAHPTGINKTVLCLDASVPCSPCATPEGDYNWNCADNVCMKSNSPQQVWRALKQIAKFRDAP